MNTLYHIIQVPGNNPVKFALHSLSRDIFCINASKERLLPGNNQLKVLPLQELCYNWGLGKIKYNFMERFISLLTSQFLRGRQKKWFRKQTQKNTKTETLLIWCVFFLYDRYLNNPTLPSIRPSITSSHPTWLVRHTCDILRLIASLKGWHCQLAFPSSFDFSHNSLGKCYFL